MTTPITKEQLIAKAREQIEFCRHTKITGEGRTHVNQCLALFEIALAALAAEPVGEFYHENKGGWYQISESDKVPDNRRIPLYAIPPAPVSVPDEMEPTVEAIKRVLPTSNPDEYAACIGADMWNACRAAMLQGADGALTCEGTRQTDELVMWIKRLAHSLKKANPDSKLQNDAMEYLSRKGLIRVEDVLR